MNYKKHYDLLMNRARERVLVGYFERHHVVPRCMNGTDRKSNIVRLTPEEHYVAHQLLVKIYPGKKGLVRATMIMTGGAAHQPRRNKLYGWLRRLFSEEMTGKPRSEETRALLSVANTGKKFSVERCTNISNGKMGKKHGAYSEEHRANISKGLTGKSLSQEHKAALSRGHTGLKQTPEHIANTVYSRKVGGYKPSAETKAKIRAAHKGKAKPKHSAESKAKRVIWLKQSWAQRKINQLAFALC